MSGRFSNNQGTLKILFHLATKTIFSLFNANIEAERKTNLNRKNGECIMRRKTIDRDYQRDRKNWLWHNMRSECQLKLAVETGCNETYQGVGYNCWADWTYSKTVRKYSTLWRNGRQTYWILGRLGSHGRRLGKVFVEWYKINQLVSRNCLKI